MEGFWPCAVGVIVLVVLGLIVAIFDALKQRRQEIAQLNDWLGRLEGEIQALRTRISRMTDPNAVQGQVVTRRETEDAKPAATVPRSVIRPETPAEVQRPEAAIAEEQAFSEAQAQSGREWWEQFEENIGKRWMTFVGVIVLFLSVGFFVKYAIDNQWLGPQTRVGIGIGVGVVLLGLGTHFVRKAMRALGQGLLGGGLAVLYVSIFSAFSVYHLISQPVAFGSMVAVTAGGMALAVGNDAIAISFIATLGGFLTPVLVSTGQNARDVLFSYILLLDLGVLGVAMFKRWRALDTLAFAGTAILFAGWFMKFYQETVWSPVLAWLMVFYAVFLILPFIYHLRRRTPATVERFVLALSNATLAFICAYVMLHKAAPHELAYVAVGMSVCYVGLAVAFRRRIPQDVASLFGFVALAMMFLTIAIPLRLGLNGITLAWAAEGAVLGYLGYRFAYRPVRVGGFIALVLVVIRVFVVHWPVHWPHDGFVPIMNAKFGVVMAVPIALWVYAAIHHAWRSIGSSGDRSLKVVAGIAAGLLALVLLHSELGAWVTGRVWAAYVAAALSVVIWALGGVAFAAVGTLVRGKEARWAGLIPLIVALFFVCELYALDLSGYSIFRNLRFEAGLLGVLALFAFAFFFRRFKAIGGEKEQGLATVVNTLAGLLLLILVSVEISFYGFVVREDYYTSCSLAGLWAAGGLVFLATGMGGRRMAYRVAGLLPILVAVVLAGRLYTMPLAFGYRPVVNTRFGAAVFAVSAVFVFAVVLFRCRERVAEDERTVGTFLGWLACLLLLVLLSVEPTRYWLAAERDEARARLLVQVSLTVVWSVYASVLLGIGFWRRIRSLRLAALGLFGITAAKVVLVDMARLHQIYRIISFFVLSLLMIGASYLYHKLDTRLKMLEARAAK